MNSLLEKIHASLEKLDSSKELELLFCEILRWNSLPGLTRPQRLQLGAPVGKSVEALPVAEIGGLWVFYIDWPEDRLPGVTARRAVQRRLAEIHLRHLVCYLTNDKRQAAFTWARQREDGKVELRTLPYEVGSPARTTIERLAELAFSLQEPADGEPQVTTLTDKLNRAFDVESVTKRFYQELANWFFWARENVYFPGPGSEQNREAYLSQSLIRLITRLKFCWFVKELGLIPRELFDLNYVAKLLKGAEDLPSSSKSRYYKAILQNLFFATLNQEVEKRAFRKRSKDPHGRDQHRGVTNLFRYEDLFVDPKEFLRLVEKIPFLNGGLFECLDRVYRAEEKENDIRIDGFSDHPKNPLSVPDYLFFGDERTVDLSDAYGQSKYNSATVRGLIHIFNRYNFTVTESTPLDQEVALDPELAGKVFENLLAAYNPETATTARKATGSYYTPRPIVDYMVDESLIAYLQTKLDETYPSETNQARLRHLLAYTEEPHQFAPDEVEALIQAIDNLKALDPACGSGVFPMGLLHKLVLILGKLDPGNERWKQRQIARVKEAMNAASRIEDALIRERTLKDLEQQIATIEDAFARKELDYGRKLYLIENCIYGVDIQPIAVQIAKMRFFISLTVDQKADPNEPNLGIRPLPNLETKFVAANALLGIERPVQGLLRNTQIDAKEAELRQVRERHFTARTPETKAKCRELDARLRAEISELLRDDGFSRETTENLANWNPYDQNATADFFDPEWMFGITDGFDIVIGNPPYIQLQKDGGRLAQELQNQGYQTFARTGDIYTLFYEKGIQLLKPGGHLTYITSNKWMRAGYGEKTRAFFATYNPIQLIDLGGGIFESATVDTNILLIQKAPNQNHCQAADLSKTKQTDFEKLTWNTLKNLGKDAWTIASDIEQRIKAKIEAKGKPLKEWDIQINYGIKTGYNEAFIIDGKKKDELIAQDPRSAEIIKPILRGRDIKRYKAEFADLWLIATFPALKLNIDDYPAVRDYLKSFGKKLHQTGEEYIDENGVKQKTRKKTGNKWFETQDQISYYQEFEKQKIVYPNMTLFLPFIFDDKGYYTNQKCFIITSEKINLKFLVAYFNSKVSHRWIRQNCPELQGGTRELSKIFFENIPIPPLTETEQQPFVALVEQILAKKEKGEDTTALEAQIDLLVYRHYELTYEEVKVIDPEFPLIKEEYEAGKPV